MTVAVTCAVAENNGAKWKKLTEGIIPHSIVVHPVGVDVKL